MGINRFKRHIYVVPEDDSNRQIVLGFIDHHDVSLCRIQTMPPAGGWLKVLKTFEDEYILVLSNNPKAHVALIVDFDGHLERRTKFKDAIPPAIKDRVFVLGSKDDPETLKKALNRSFEKIGHALADDCTANTTAIWDHDQLRHNARECERLIHAVKPFLFAQN